VHLHTRQGAKPNLRKKRRPSALCGLMTLREARTHRQIVGFKGPC
jgi:hypothetical protein